MKSLHYIAFLLVIIGGLNWLLVGLGGFFGANWNVVNLVLGSMPGIESSVYVLIGLAAVYKFVVHKKDCRVCNPSGM